MSFPILPFPTKKKNKTTSILQNVRMFNRMMNPRKKKRAVEQKKVVNRLNNKMTKENNQVMTDRLW
jgi:hypothetical protein